MTRSIGRSLILLLLAWLCAAPGHASAAESYDGCSGFITSLPAVIGSEGIWCLKQDLATSITSGAAIFITSSNVTIDCNGFKVGGLGAGPNTSATGILTGSHFHVTVRNCNVRGFSSGIYLGTSSATGAGDYLVEDNRVDGNTHYGINVGGDGSIVRHNLVINTGGTPNCCQTGIHADYAVYVLDNTVSGVVSAAGYARGIEGGFNDASMSGNHVSGLDGGGQMTGIISSLGHTTIRQNTLMGTGAAVSYGIYCNDSNVVAKDNMMNGLPGITSCSDAGGNDSL